MTMEFNRESIKEMMYVPSSVETELRRNVENQLKKCGIFYRVFSRRKSAASLEHKLASGKYGGDDGKKIQDLIGIRVNLYFQDDLDICKELFEDIYELVDGQWSENDITKKNFEAAKINGVFKLPQYLVNKISPSTWDMHIDQTFEIQLKTVFFEGWHEVEHDFRYKMNIKEDGELKNIWDQYASYSRQFNSVVATLELCDRSMVTMFENFAHQLYKDHVWDMMLRMHFRVRISDKPMYDGLAEILERDHAALGKKLFKADRRLLIEPLKTLYREVPLSVNMIIAILNETVLENNADINDIMMKHNVYKDGVPEQEQGYVRRELIPLEKHYVFKNSVFIKSKRSSSITVEEVYKKISSYVYKWAREKFRPIFLDIPDECCEYNGVTPGYQVRFSTNENGLELSMYTSHISQDGSSRMWNTEVEMKPDAECTGIWIDIKNIMYDQKNISEIERVSRFSYPNFYRNIYEDSDLSIIDVQPYGYNVYGLREESQLNDLLNLIYAQHRQTPVVIVASDKNEDDPLRLDEKWIGENWINNFHRQVRYYAHTYRCDIERLSYIMQCVGAEEEYNRGVYVFWPASPIVAQEGEINKNEISYDVYDENAITNCVYSRYKGEGTGIREDKVKDGAKAFTFMLVDEIKKWIIKD